MNIALLNETAIHIAKKMNNNKTNNNNNNNKTNNNNIKTNNNKNYYNNNSKALTYLILMELNLDLKLTFQDKLMGNTINLALKKTIIIL